jgi:2-methylcitrate synthase
MDVMRTVCSVMGVLEPENPNFSDQESKILRLMSIFGPALLYWHHYSNSGIK